MTEKYLPKEGDLQVWWIPQVPMKAFTVNVKSISEAKLLLTTLADYDLFQYNHRVKPDHAIAGGLNVYSNNIDGDGTRGWMTWYSEDGYDIDEIDEFGNLIEE